MANQVVELVLDTPAKVLKTKPYVVSVRVKYEDGGTGQWWIPCPTTRFAEAMASWVNEVYVRL